MSRSSVISNSSPLIALERVGRLDLIRQLFGRVDVPPAVAREVFEADTIPNWIEVVTLSGPVSAKIPLALGAGEREAIALALEQPPTWVVLDDLPARRLAATLGLPVIGTVGLLLAAKQQALIPLLEPLLNDLEQADFRLSLKVREAVLQAAGELQIQ